MRNRVAMMLLIPLSNLFILIFAGHIMASAQSDVTATPFATISTHRPTINSTNANNLAELANIVDAKQGEWIENVAFSPDSMLLATIDTYGIAAVYDTRTWAEVKLLDPRNNPSSDAVTQVRFSPDGTMLASTSDKDIFIWDVTDIRTQSNPRPKYTLKGHEIPVGSIAFSPDSKLLISGDYDAHPNFFKNKTATLRFWKMSTGQQLQVFDTNGFVIGEIITSTSGDMFAFSLDNIQLHVWSVAKLREITIYRIKMDVTSTFAFKQDGTLIAAQATFIDNPTSTIDVFEVKTGKAIAKFHLEEYAIGTVLAFSPDQTLLISGDATEGGKGLDVWDIPSGKAAGHIDGPGAVTNITFSPDKTLIADGQDGAGLAQALAHVWGIKQ